MSSHDLLEGLFDTEHEAARIVETARHEARARIEAAKAQAREAVEAARVRAYAASREAEAEARAALDAEYQTKLDDFRTNLASSRIDYERFARECGRAIDELFPG